MDTRYAKLPGMIKPLSEPINRQDAKPYITPTTLVTMILRLKLITIAPKPVVIKTTTPASIPNPIARLRNREIPPFRVFGLTGSRNEGGGERHRGMTSGQHGPKSYPGKQKVPGRHIAVQVHEITLSVRSRQISHTVPQHPCAKVGIFLTGHTLSKIVAYK